MTSANILIEAQGINLNLDGQAILQDIALSIAPNEIITLIGPNGSGKTTLVRIVLGLLKPDSGRLVRSSKLRIAYMPQKLQIDNTLPITVERFLQLADDFDAHALMPILEEVGAEKLLQRPLHSVSGGELRRIWLARCLLRKPELLVLDEPVQGVDANGQEELYALIKRIRDRYRCAVLMVSHDLHLVMAATDQVVCLNHHVCCTGHPESVQKHPEFLKLFGTNKTNLAVYTHHHDHSHDIHGDVHGEVPASDGRFDHKECKHD